MKSLLATLLMPGTVVLLLPYLILRGAGTDLRTAEASVRTVAATAIGLAGLAMLLHAISEFAVHGKGTLAPVNPPKSLVLRGMYRQTRNPMYVGVLTVLAAEALFFGSVPLLAYTASVSLLFHAFVILYEEPHLRRQFGEAYEHYCQTVPRWPLPFGGKNRRGLKIED